MFRYILPLGAVLAILPLQAQTAPMQNNQNQNSQKPVVQESMSRNDAAAASQSNSKLRTSNDISRVLDDTIQARTEIAQNNTAGALGNINDALSYLHQAQTAAPNEKLMPLFTETDDYSVMGPILASRTGASAQMNQPGQVRPSNQVGNNQTAATNSGGGLTVQKAYGEFTSVALDPQLARTHLESAKAELQQGHMTKADEGLKAVQDGVVVASVEGDLPLLRARENLMLARSGANSGDYYEAREALRAADRALDNYAKLNGSYAADARTLAAQIRSYDRNAGQNTANMSTEINNWWGQTTEWINTGTSNSNNISE